MSSKEPVREQIKLYEPIKKWLESKGFDVVSDAEKIPVLVKDIFPIRSWIHPDVVGIKSINEVCVVEVEINLDKIWEVMGKCMLWKTTATFVYIAFPKEKCNKFEVLKKFGIGLLGVSKDDVEEVIKIFPEETYDLLSLIELHPLNHEKEREFYNQIKRIIA